MAAVLRQVAAQVAIEIIKDISSIAIKEISRRMNEENSEKN